MNKLYNQPHNLLRKAFALKECVKRLEDLQHRYMPIFNDDPVINSLLEQLRAESDSVMNVLRCREDAMELLETNFQED